MIFLSKTIKINILFIALAIICIEGYSQHGNIKSVNLLYGEALEKNPNRYIKIKLLKESDSCFTCNVETITIYRKRWKTDTTKTDNVYQISSSDFYSVVDMYLNIDTYAITSRMIDNYYFILHPNSISLSIESYCGLINSITLYNINERIKKKQIEPFLAICRDILLLAKIEPNKYCPKKHKNR